MHPLASIRFDDGVGAFIEIFRSAGDQLFLFALAAVIALPGRHGENGGMTEMGSAVVSILLAVLAGLLWLALWVLRQGA